jgi:hypothetical protein
MTNTLHRRGSHEDLQGDYVVFATTAGGYNREGSAEKLRTFMRIALKHNPVNISDSKQGVEHQRNLNEMIESMTDGSGASCAFDNLESVRDMLLDLKEADLGISINISGLLDEVHKCCRSMGIHRHSMEHSLGVSGHKDRLPNSDILELNTLCGHGMISFNLIKRMIDLVKLGKLTPAQAAETMAKPCVCGAFNPRRAEMVLEKLRALG